jgi:TRAP-type uncharacterized transport system fused permease subunit
MFHQILSPTGNLALTWLVALVPVVMLLVLLAVFRVSAGLATLIGSLVTFLLAGSGRCLLEMVCVPICIVLRPASGP